MIIKFEYGLIYKGIKYGWKSRHLYRLPYTNKDGISYPLKRLNQITFGNKVGYRLSGDRKSIEQLKELTVIMDYKYSEVKSVDCPF